MKYPYIPLTPLVAEAQSDVKRLTAISQFNDEDMYLWAVDCMRELGGQNYDKQTVYLTVTKHTAHLPKDFYLIDKLSLCKGSELRYAENLHPDAEPFKWVPTTVLRPANGEASRYCTGGCLKPGRRGQDLHFTVSKSRNIRVSFHTGKLELVYLYLPQQDGEFMVQDEINGIKAIKAYIKLMLIQEGFIMGDVAQYVYRELKSEYEHYLGLGQQAMKFPDPSETTYMALKQDARFRRFRNR